MDFSTIIFSTDAGVLSTNTPALIFTFYDHGKFPHPHFAASTSVRRGLLHRDVKPQTFFDLGRVAN